jgi:hypothetical protein
MPMIVRSSARIAMIPEMLLMIPPMRYPVDTRTPMMFRFSA